MDLNGKWAVVAPGGKIVFRGDKPSCREYIRVILEEDAGIDYLRIIKAR